MPKPKKSERDALRDWESLLAALREAGRPGPPAGRETETTIEKGDTVMPRSRNSQSSIFHDWEMLLTAVQKNADLLGDLEPYRSALDQALSAAWIHKTRQLSLKAASREETRLLLHALAQGNLAASRLRSLLRAVLGPRNERLVQFGVAPLRERPRRQRTPQE